MKNSLLPLVLCTLIADCTVFGMQENQKETRVPTREELLKTYEAPIPLEEPQEKTVASREELLKSYVPSVAAQAAASDLMNQNFLDAARKGDLTAMRALFQSPSRPDINARDQLKQTALMIAAHRLDYPMVDFLLMYDPKIDLKDPDGYTALMQAVNREPLLDEMKKNQHWIITQLLFRNAEVNAQAKKDGISALILAVAHNNMHVVSQLLQAGAKVNHKTKPDGMTALMAAARNRNRGIVARLLAAGADTTLKDKRGDTAADYAAGDPEILNLIAPNEKVVAELQRLREPLMMYDPRSESEL